MNPVLRSPAAMSPFTSPMPRRHFLRRGIQMAVSGASLSQLPAHANAPTARTLTLDHTHTGEHLSLVYALGDQYLPNALQTLNHFLRDHYCGDIGVIDPQLFDQLHRLQQTLGSTQAYQVISGYRAPATNAQLRISRTGGVAQNSLHMRGQAIDVRLGDVALADLHRAALALNAGGVGFYPHERFIHLDTGRVRHW